MHILYLVSSSTSYHLVRKLSLVLSIRNLQRVINDMGAIR